MINEQLKLDLNKIVSYLAEGAAWHCKAANEMRLIPCLRGYARWNDDIEAENDAVKKIHLSKEITDYFKYVPVVDTSMSNRAEGYSIGGFEGFKRMWDIWLDREKEFAKILMSGISNASRENIDIYQKLCNLSKDVAEEIYVVDKVKSELVACNWNMHDVRRISETIHEHVEKHKNRDFNIG